MLEFAGWVLLFAVGCLALSGLLGAVQNRNAALLRSETGAYEVFGAGVYLGGGLEGEGQRAVGSFATCAVTDDEFQFFSRKTLIGHIPRDAVVQVSVEDLSSVQSRVTATRLVALGPFALAAPKKTRTKSHHLFVEWEPHPGTLQAATFQWSGVVGDRAHAEGAAQKLRSHVKPRGSRLAPDERTCPKCAEVIKAAAKLCRHCGSNLDERA